MILFEKYSSYIIQNISSSFQNKERVIEFDVYKTDFIEICFIQYFLKE